MVNIMNWWKTSTIVNGKLQQLMENFNNQWKTSTINGKLHELIKKKLGTFGEKIMFDVFN